MLISKLLGKIFKLELKNIQNFAYDIHVDRQIKSLARGKKWKSFKTI